MAITITQVLDSRTLQAWDITTTADADTTVNITSAEGYAMFEPDGITSIIPQFVVIQQHLDDSSHRVLYEFPAYSLRDHRLHQGIRDLDKNPP